MGRFTEEARGTISKRQRENAVFNLSETRGRQITAEYGSISPEIQFAELRLGNLCNLKCRSCNPHSSNKWTQDYEALQKDLSFVRRFEPNVDFGWCEREEFWSELVGHSKKSMPTTWLDASSQVVGIDEGQFLGDKLPSVASILAEQGKRVIIAGLDMDWRGRPFGPMPHLMSIAEIVDKQHAICRVCGGPASRTQRLIASDEDILVGSGDAYEARCPKHLDPEMALKPLTVAHHPLTLSDL